MAQKEFERGAGILMHISSLPSPYGIGSFGKDAYEFVDRLVGARQKILAGFASWNNKLWR